MLSPIRYDDNEYKKKRNNMMELLGFYKEYLEIKELFKTGYAKELIESIKQKRNSESIINQYSIYASAIEELLDKCKEYEIIINSDKNLKELNKYKEENLILREQNEEFRKKLEEINIMAKLSLGENNE